MFVAFARMVEARLSALERRQTLGVRGPGRAREATCEMCGRVYVQRSTLGRRCDGCRAEWKRQHNRQSHHRRRLALVKQRKKEQIA